MTFRQKLMGGIALYAVTLVLPAHAGVLGHTGSTTSNPPGTGAQSFIDLDCSTISDSSDTCTKTYNGNLGAGLFHFMSIIGSEINGSLIFNEAIVNNTDQSWSDYHFVFNGVTQFGENFASNLPNGVSSTSQTTATTWDIFFENGVIGPGQQFTIGVFLDGIVEGSIQQAPSLAETQQDVPEPASLALMGAGLAGLATLRRRRRAEA